MPFKKGLSHRMGAPGKHATDRDRRSGDFLFFIIVDTSHFLIFRRVRDAANRPPFEGDVAHSLGDDFQQRAR